MRRCVPSHGGIGGGSGVVCFLLAALAMAASDEEASLRAKGVFRGSVVPRSQGPRQQFTQVAAQAAGARVPRSQVKCFGRKQHQPRWCEYQDVYLDTATLTLLFLDPDGVKSGNTVCQPDWPATCSREVAGANGTEVRPDDLCSDVKVTPVARLPNTTLWVGQTHVTVSVVDGFHSNFVHSFFEWAFSVAWVHAEYARRWGFVADDFTLLLAGPRVQEQANKFADAITVTGDGSLQGFMAKLLSLVAHRKVLHGNAPGLKHNLPAGVVWLPRVLVGGRSGRSPWNHDTYTEPRSVSTYDGAFSRAAKSAAFVNFIERFIDMTPAPSRMAPTYAKIADEGYIYVINRDEDPTTERGLYRTVSNIGSLHSTLKAKFGDAVADEVFTFNTITGSRDQAVQTMRKVRILVAPHGANLANLAFLPPGAGLVELAVKGHMKRPMMYDEIAKLSSVEYAAVFSGGSKWGSGPIVANINEVVVAVAGMLERTTVAKRAEARAKVQKQIETPIDSRLDLDRSCRAVTEPDQAW